MFYRVFRAMCRIALHVFFRRIDVEGSPDLWSGPLILAPNHANSLVDPLLLMIATRRRITLTAKSGLWQNPLLRLLRWGLGIVSFERPDAGPAVWVARANASALARCREHLDRGAALCLFPEGVSHSDRELRPFRTGLARLALGTPGDRLRILPVGLLYTAKGRIRSDVWIRFGEPIELSRWMEEHPRGDAAELTAEIRRRVEALIVESRADRETRLLSWAARLLAERYADEDGPAERYLRQQRLRAGLLSPAAARSGPGACVRRVLRCHRVELTRRRLSPEAPLARGRGRSLLGALREAELLLVGAPTALFGVVNHALPALAVRGIARALSRDEDHWATNTVYPALVVFPLAYALQVAVAARLVGVWALAYAVALPFSGWLALCWCERVARALRRTRYAARLRFAVGAGARRRIRQVSRELVRALAAGAEAAAPAVHDAARAQHDALFAADAALLRGTVVRLRRIEEEFVASGMSEAAERRGYFAPDEDDRVRRMLVAFGGLRETLWDIIERHRGYERVDGARGRLLSFLVGYAAAVTSYAYCLRLIRHCEGARQLRRKLDEPDARFGLGAGFFEEILEANTSWRNARDLARAQHFWSRSRSRLAELGLARDPVCAWLVDVVERHEAAIRRAWWSVLLRRARYDWFSLWRSAADPLGRLAYAVTRFCGARLAVMRRAGAPAHAIDRNVLAALRPRLREGDVLIVRAEAKLTAAVLPGFWTHAALYAPEAGGEAGLGSVVEAHVNGVVRRPVEGCLEADHLLVLRPRVSEAECRRAVAEALSHLGKAYDFGMDFGTTTRLVCTELVYRCYQGRGGLDFPLVRRLGRYTLSCDDMVALLLAPGQAPRLPFDVVWLGLRCADGRHHVVPPGEELPWLRRIAAGLRPTGLAAGALLTPELLEVSA